MKKTVCILLAVFMMLSLVSCKKETVRANDPNEFRIITSFYPIYVTTLNLIEGAENVTLINLMSENHGCMHGYMLTQDDLTKMGGADLFIASGMGMEAFVGKSYLGIPQMELLNCGEDIKHEVERDGEVNSHYWMNTENLLQQCERIKRTLCRLDPENANTYEANAEKYKAKIDSLTVEGEKRCEKLPDGELIVYHDSLDYFADQFGINIVSIPDSKAGNEEYIRKASAAGIVLVQKDIADSEGYREFEKKTGCKTLLIDIVTSGDEGADAKNAYSDAFRHNLSIIEQALS